MAFSQVASKIKSNNLNNDCKRLHRRGRRMDDDFYIQMIKDLSRNDLAIRETEQQFDVLARRLESAKADLGAYKSEIGELRAQIRDLREFSLNYSGYEEIGFVREQLDRLSQALELTKKARHQKDRLIIKVQNKMQTIRHRLNVLVHGGDREWYQNHRPKAHTSSEMLDKWLENELKKADAKLQNRYNQCENQN